MPILDMNDMAETWATALDGAKKGGDREKGAIFALLFVGQAINNLADELRGMGTELHPINTWEQNR